MVPPTSDLYLCFKKDEMSTSENMNDFFQLDLSGFALSREYFNSTTYISRYHSSEFSDIGYINKNTLNLVSTFRKIEKSIELSENQRFLDMGDIKYAEWKIFYGFLQDISYDDTLKKHRKIFQESITESLYISCSDPISKILRIVGNTFLENISGVFFRILKIRKVIIHTYILQNFTEIPFFEFISHSIEEITSINAGYNLDQLTLLEDRDQFPNLKKITFFVFTSNMEYCFINYLSICELIHLYCKKWDTKIRIQASKLKVNKIISSEVINFNNNFYDYSDCAHPYLLRFQNDIESLKICCLEKYVLADDIVNSLENLFKNIEISINFVNQITFDDCVFGDNMLCFTASDFEESKIRVKIISDYDSEVNNLSEHLQKYFFELEFVLENHIRGIRRKTCFYINENKTKYMMALRKQENIPLCFQVKDTAMRV
ncbi:hypothetical protein CWI38_0034p0040 [Hamiltosporidium tvaerminnensis]|uniref:Uncharacterized protein n=1 Tax=Hamiltosporidium tvaerminnensis TaxID=1176355 RepID=A0A4Q9M3V2_9MICR|nr:hypothetical protein CWI38_0034p0040 [Hamiltosporidium tvaerminnensis]